MSNHGNRVRFWILKILSVLSAVYPFVFSSTASAADSRHESPTRAWGTTLGFPQLLALTLETHRTRPLRFQMSVSPLLLINSATVRVIRIRTTGRIRSYGFLGGGILHIGEGESGGAVGSTGFFWGGVGLVSRLGWFDLSAEVGAIGGMNRMKGFEPVLPALAVGLLINP